MAESSVSFLLKQLTLWLQQEQELLGGLKSEVEYIQGEMGQMRAFLRVADAKEESDPQLKEWVRQVREVAYDTEDILEKYMLHFAPRGEESFRGRLKKLYNSTKRLMFRHKIASEIKTIKTRVENASKSQQRFRDLCAIMDQGSTADNTFYDGRNDALLLEEADVVGIEKPKKKLLEWLRSADYGLRVISVVGMGGLGKTTLVKKVYSDENLKTSFLHHVWITISESFKVEDLLGDIIRQLMQEVKQPPPQGLEADGMREFIYKFLQHKNYVVVLDDVWRISAWEAIKYAFPRRDTHGRGRVVITTRDQRIADATTSETSGHTYNLEPLDMKKSRKLFYRKAFPNGSQCPPYLEEVGENILKRCNGLPLAIVVISRLLATKNEKLEEWEMCNQRLDLEEDSLKRVTKLLSLSYYDLPYYLKSCFLYLSIFPADHMLEKSRLIHLWVPEGFVEAKQGKTPEEVAEGYLNELLNRSLVQVAKTSKAGRPTRFRVHDLLQEYIISKSKEENMVAIENGEESRWTHKIRRITIHNSLKCPQEIDGFKFLRTLFLLGNSVSESGPRIQKILNGSCDLLKVLDLRGGPLETIPNGVFKFYLLKYLSVRDTMVSCIPKLIGNLQKLETLDLKRTRVTELPVEILKLRNIRHILVYRYLFSSNNIPYEFVQGFKAPFAIGCLTSLQKLCYIEASGYDNESKIVVEIGKLIQLKRLGIINVKQEDGLELCSSLVKLTKLRSLIISVMEGEVMDLEFPISGPSSPWPFLHGLLINGSLEKLPNWVVSLYSLTRLQLRWSRLRDDPLKYLQNLPNLVHLGMTSAYEGVSLSFKTGGFPRLKKLWLQRFGALRWVRIKRGCMPLLEYFNMWNCEMVVELPEGIEHLTKLQEANFVNMAEKFVASFKDKKTKQIIARIPKLSACSVAAITSYNSSYSHLEPVRLEFHEVQNRDMSLDPTLFVYN